MALVALAPAVLLARSESIAALVAGTAAVFGCAFACSAIVRALPEVARGYVSARLCSARYLLPAAGLPLLSALALARFGLPALLAVGAHHVILAHRYRRRWTRPGALRVALFPAAIGGLFCALECLALRGREWRYGGRLLYAEESPLQRIVLVERAGSLELFIDGELQFRSADERLYHDGLLAPALERLRTRARVLVLGGGDGLATRDLLRCPRVEHVTIVDWDCAVTRLFRSHAALRALNERALLDARVRVIHRDVRSVLAETGEAFDLVVGDLTDPRSIPQSARVSRRMASWSRTRRRSTRGPSRPSPKRSPRPDSRHRSTCARFHPSNRSPT